MNLLKAAATVSGMTMVSRITGLIRENLTATVFGASGLTDAFFVAFRLPNLLRRLFAEGAFSQAFVPILAEARNDDPARTRQLVDRIATALFWVVLTVTVLAIIAAPGLVWLMATGLTRDPASFDAAVLMTRLMFPYILFMSLIALSAGVLNTWRQFAIPAFTPVLLNLSFIGAALGLSRFFDPPVYALAAGVIIGGLAQLAIQIPALARIGMLPRISFRIGEAFRDPKTRETMRLMGPAVFAVSVAQLSLIINTNIASRLTAGSVSWVNYGDRLMEFPSALLGVALGTVLLPSLARAGARGEHAEYSALLDWGLRLCVLLAVPCMVGLAFMAEPLTAMLFHYGRFRDLDVAMTQQAVVGYSVGLLGLIAIKVLAPGFYARKDVRTPVKIGLLALVVTQLLNLLLVPIFAHAGLTLSISLAAMVNAGLMMIGLYRRQTWRPAPGWPALLARVVLGAIAMMAILIPTVSHFDWLALRAEPWTRIGLTFGLIAAAGGAYALVLLATGVRPRDFRRRTGP